MTQDETVATLRLRIEATGQTPLGELPIERLRIYLDGESPLVHALHELLLTWLPRLRPEGRAVMVVGKNLGADSLTRWLGEQGFPTTRSASAKGFRVLESRRG